MLWINMATARKRDVYPPIFGISTIVPVSQNHHHAGDADTQSTTTPCKI
jgi:hypothetical protein